MKKKFFAVAAVMISSQLFGQTMPAIEDSSITLDPVVVSTSKFPKKQSATGKVVTLITKQQLQQSSGNTLAELLNAQAGVTIPGVNSNMGTNLTTSIRGSSAGNVLILIDGLPVTDPSTNNNYFDLNFINVDFIERIEILKGGQSTLYGSDAVAGVINIITRTPGEKNFLVHGSFTAGSYKTYKQNIGIAGKQSKFDYHVQYLHQTSDGFSAANDSAGNKNFDKDGFKQHDVNGTFNIYLGKKLQASFFTSYNVYETDLDAAAFTDEKDFTAKNKNLQAGIGLVYKKAKSTFRFNYHFNYVNRAYLDDSTFKSSIFLDYSKSNYTGRSHFVEFYSNWNWPNWELLAGIDYRFNNSDQSSLYVFPSFPYPPFVYETKLDDSLAKMFQTSPYASLIFKKNKFTTEAGVRVNFHSEYGHNTSFTFNPSLLIKNKLKLFANLYSAFKIPTLYQLFDPAYGTKNLQPEKGMIAEAGIAFFSGKKYDLRIVGFYRKTKDAIDFIVTNPSTFESHYMNISEQKNYGVEVEAAYNIDKWNFRSNYTYTDGNTKSRYDGTGMQLSKDTTYYNLYRIPKHAFNFHTGFQLTTSFFASAQIHVAGKRFEPVFASLPVELKAYHTIDVYGEYKFGKKLKLFAELKNLTDQKYFEINGYNTKRLNFLAGLHFNF